MPPHDHGAGFARGRPRQALVVEDQADTREWLAAALLGAFPDIAITRAARRQGGFDWLRSGVARRTAVPGEPDDIALIDLGLPDGSGIELVREIADHYPGVIPVVATIYDDDAHLFEAIAAGARGYLLKDGHADTLVHYLHRIDIGEPPLSPSIARRVLAHFRRPARVSAGGPDEAALTPREAEVLGLLGRGMRIREAAGMLGLTHHTVAGYVKAIYRKLNVSSRAEAALEAARRRMV